MIEKSISKANYDVLLLIECCKEKPSINKIEEYSSNIKNWDTFIYQSKCHGILPLVYKILCKINSSSISSDLIKKLQSENFLIVKNNMLITSELINITQKLREYDIDIISFKGPTLSNEAYGNITLRQYCDLDLLINKKNILKVEELLKPNYKRVFFLSKSQEESWFNYAHDLSLYNKNGIYLEFHWSMFDLDHPINLKELDFFNNKKEVFINNQIITTISNELLLIYLCVHGSKHLYERIEWVVDIDKFIKTHEIDWLRFNKLILNKNYEKFVLLGLFLSENFFDTKFPIENKKYIEDLSIISDYIFDIWNNKKEFNNKNNLYYTLKLFVSNFDKIKYLHKVYLKPTLNEYWYISLPKYLHFLYYPLRQYLLLKKYFVNKS